MYSGRLTDGEMADQGGALGDEEEDQAAEGQGQAQVLGHSQENGIELCKGPQGVLFEGEMSCVAQHLLCQLIILLSHYVLRTYKNGDKMG